MTEDLERTVRERIAAGFSPVPAEDHEQNVRAKMVGASTATRRTRRGHVFATIGALAAALLGVLLLPRLVPLSPATLTPLTSPSGPSSVGRVAPAPGPASGWRGALNSGVDETGAAKRGTKRRDLADAAMHLSFDPVLPRDLPGHGALAAVYTFSAKDGAPGGAALDNALGAFYTNDLGVIEKQWDPRLVKDHATFAAVMTKLRGPAQSRVLNGVTVLTWGSPAAGSKKRVPAQASWFADGVGYTLTSPTLPLDLLVTVAGAMIG